MATSNTGGWVRRVGSTGGGRTYRQRRPVNYYGVIGIVVVLGIASVSLARYDYRKHPTVPPVPQPAPGTTWFAALGIDVCGARVASVPADPFHVSTTGYEVLRTGPIWISPQNAAQGGTNATVGAFVASYKGLTVDTSELRIPVAATKHRHASALTYHTGEACPKGTPDAGKVGRVVVATWANQYTPANKAALSTDPFLVRFTHNNMLVTLAFVPKGEIPLRPSQQQINAVFTATTATTTTTTTTFPIPSTSHPTTTTRPRGTTTTTTTKH